MYLYRRQTPKKRPKSGTPRKGRSQQKGLPGSARELLPIIQPATKALAQMLAGRTAASGQLGHARSVLAQTEKLVADRAHNRLNPAEREEFFEQVARLKLTLSDAESEAEFQAAEEQEETVEPVPVDRERLKAMALSLTASSAEAREAAAEAKKDALAAEAEQAAAAEASASRGGDGASPISDQVDGAAANAGDGSDDRLIKKSSETTRSPRKTGDAQTLTLQPGTTVNIDGTKRRRKPKVESVQADKTATRSGVTRPPVVKEKAAGPVADDAKPPQGQKLPKGWIIDDEGFVVPGPS